MKRMKTAKTISFLMVLLLVLQLLPLGTALATDAELEAGPEEIVDAIPSDELSKDAEESPEGGDSDFEDPGKISAPPDEPGENRTNKAQARGGGVSLFSMASWITYNLDVVQDGVSVPNGGTIDIKKNFSVAGSFNDIPLSAPGNYIEKGDTFKFKISNSSDSIKFDGASMGLTATLNKVDGGTETVTVGAVTFASEANGFYAIITFDDGLWDDNNPAEPKYIAITNLLFNATLEYDGDELGEGWESSDIVILDKTVRFVNPIPPIYPTLVKAYTGPDDDGVISWSVTLDAKDAENIAGQKLAGITFTDKLPTGVTYNDDFQITKSTSGDVAKHADLAKDGTNGTLEYVFADDSPVIGPVTITYTTTIAEWDEVKMGLEDHTYTNEATAVNQHGSANDSKTVEVKGIDWVQKAGFKSDADGVKLDDTAVNADYVTWYVTLQSAAFARENVYAIDNIPTDTVTKIQWEKKVGTNWVGQGDDWTTKNTDHKYPYPAPGTVAAGEEVRLRITVPTGKGNGEYTSGGTLNNTAEIRWGSNGKYGGTDVADGVGYGKDALVKSGSFDGNDGNWNKNHKVNWDVTVDLTNVTSSDLSQYAVYDLLIYDKAGNVTPVQPGAFTGTWSDLTPRYGQRLIDGESGITITTTDTSKPTASIIPVLNASGTRVGDLIKVTGFSTKTSYTISFSTKITDFESVIRNSDNGNISVTNNASLFYGTTERLEKSASPTKSATFLKKAAIIAGDGITDGSVNAKSPSNSSAGLSGFNHNTRIAYFRLDINESEQDFTDADFKNKTTIVVTDTLPTGWKFDEDFNAKGYKIYKHGDDDTALTTEIDPASLVTSKVFSAYSSSGRQTVQFTFDNTLKDRYYIIVKAELPEDIYQQLIKGSTTASVLQTNNATFAAGGKTVNANASVHVNSTVLSKISNGTGNGIANWTIEYNPMNLTTVVDHQTVVIRDTLLTGIEPYVTSGVLDTTESRFVIQKATMGANGQLTVTDATNLAPSWIAAGHLTYNAATRLIEITLPTDAKDVPYRITYKTAITLEKKGSVGNEVEVVGMTVDTKETDSSYAMKDSDASASLRLGGYLRLQKVNANDGNRPITGGDEKTAEFTLTTHDRQQIIRRGRTNRDSALLQFGALPPNTTEYPYYILKETGEPKDFYSDGREYHVVVEDENGLITTTVTRNGNLIATFISTADPSSIIPFDVPNWSDVDTVPEYGNLKVQKTVVNGDGNKEFRFTVTFSKNEDINLDEYYNYIGEGGKASGTLENLDNTFEFTLKDGESITILRLPKGAEYTVTEGNYSSEGYQTTQSGAEGTISPSEPGNATFINTIPAPYFPGAATISVFKTDEDGAKLPGAVFTLYDSTGKAVASVISGTDGIAEFTNVAPDSSFTIRETAAPEGYELSTETISVKTGDSTTHSFTMVNKKSAPDKGIIEIHKTNEDGNSLPGASFTLYDKDGKAVATVVSDAAGLVRFTDIPVGSYTIRETAAPEGYVLSTEVLSITLEKDATRSFTFVNRRDEQPVGSAGSLSLLKVNNEGQQLAGAEFSLYGADGNLVARAVTGTDGVVRFTNLPFGTYSIRETAAPTGYQLFEGAQTVEISAATPDRSFTLRNTREDEPGIGGWEEEETPGTGGWEDGGTPGGKLPQTGGIPKSFFLLLAGVALLGVGIFTLKGRKAKRKPNAPGTDE